jgi:hypothetical protein
MRKRSKPADPPPPQPESRLDGVRALAHDEEDERPSREDRTYGETIFTRGLVPLPRILQGRRRRG